MYLSAETCGVEVEESSSSISRLPRPAAAVTRLVVDGDDHRWRIHIQQQDYMTLHSMSKVFDNTKAMLSIDRYVDLLVSLVVEAVST